VEILIVQWRQGYELKIAQPQTDGDLEVVFERIAISQSMTDAGKRLTRSGGFRTFSRKTYFIHDNALNS